MQAIREVCDRDKAIRRSSG